MRIWKFPIKQGEPIVIPEGGQPLHVEKDPQGVTCIWALIDPELDTVTRQVIVLGTGWDVPPEAVQYVGTIHEGSFVWHIYLGEEE